MSAGEKMLVFLSAVAVFVMAVFLVWRTDPGLFADLLVRFFTSSQISVWRKVLAIWEVIAAVLAVLFTVGIIISLSRAFRFRTRIRTKVPDFSTAGTATVRDKIVKKDWNALIKKAETATEANAALLVVEADTVVDKALRHIGIVGETMAERIKALEGQRVSLDDLWEVHKIRNNIAHTPGYTVTLQQLEGILKKYQKVLAELDVI